MPPLRDENVGGFDVTMNDALAVSSIERIGDLDGNRDNTFRIQGSCGNQVFQSHSIQIFHGDERLAVLLANVINRTDAGMIQSRCGLGFPLKTDQ